MNEKDAPFELCFKVLRRLQENGVLKELVLVGSWCAYFYKDYFKGKGEFSALRTRDIDFLIRTPPKIRQRANIPDLLADLGFVTDFNREGYMRMAHPELIIDFLVPERGRGNMGPYPVKSLGVNAQPLRFMNLLSSRTVSVESRGFELVLPHPIEFGLHKLLVSGRRKKPDKKAKDRTQALEILRAVMNGRDRDEIKPVFEGLPGGWRKAILANLKSSEDQDVIDLLTVD